MVRDFLNFFFFVGKNRNVTPRIFSVDAGHLDCYLLHLVRIAVGYIQQCHCADSGGHNRDTDELPQRAAFRTLDYLFGTASGFVPQNHHLQFLRDGKSARN